MKTLRWILYAILGAILMVTVIVGAWMLWLQSEDPIAFAALPMPSYRLVSEQDYPIERAGERRIYRDLEFVTDHGAPIRVTISLPATLLPEPLPVMVILCGLRSGRKRLERLPSLGQNAAMAFEYPYKEQIRDKTSSAINRLIATRRSALETPMHLLSMLHWLGRQSWADTERISILGYSLGAVFVPIIHHKAQLYGLPLGPSILAFGGADLGLIVPNSLKLKSPVLRWFARRLANAVLRPIEPAFHLPHTNGDFLFIIADRDELVPDESQQLMIALTPEPKTVIRLPGTHIDPRDQVVLDRVVNVTRTWLIQRGAVNDFD